MGDIVVLVVFVVVGFVVLVRFFVVGEAVALELVGASVVVFSGVVVGSCVDSVVELASGASVILAFGASVVVGSFVVVVAETKRAPTRKTEKRLEKRVKDLQSS